MRKLIIILFLLLTVLAAGPALAAQQQAPAQDPDSSGQVAAYEEKFYADDDIWDASGNLIEDKTQSQQPDYTVPDPLEGWNRFWFEFNDKFYFGVAKPVAQVYGFVVPEFGRRWVRNFFENLLYPVRLVNCVLQGKLNSAGVETARFLGNTVFGLGGLGAPMDSVEPTRPTPPGDEDFGQTLGAWGAGQGFYLVWPVLGPSSGRDTVGMVGDYFLTPTTYLNPWYWSLAAKSYKRLNELSLRIGEYEALKDASIDPYEAFKDAYIRYRAKKVAE